MMFAPGKISCLFSATAAPKPNIMFGPGGKNGRGSLLELPAKFLELAAQFG